MKKIRIFCLCLAISALTACLCPAVGAEETDQSVLSGCHSVDAAQPLSDEGRLADTAKAVILYERNSDTMLYAYDPDLRIYPSSMVKLMTALVALENGDLNDTVTVTRQALSYVAIGSVSAGLTAGEALSLESLLYCMMTASANDAATVIAEHIAGGQDAFVAMMNERAAELGCRDTHFSNVHGLHDEDCYTTARDICRITDYALDNEMFKTLFCAKSFTVPATNKQAAREIITSNHMMSTAETSKYYDSRVTGGKTGATDQAGRCLVATAESGGMELLTVVMGAKPTYTQDRLSVVRYGSFEETAELLDYAFSAFSYRQIFYEGQIIAQYPVSGGENNVVVQPLRTQATVLPKDLSEEQLTWVYSDRLDAVIAPVAQGQTITTLQVWYGSKCLAQTELVAVHAVDIWAEPTQPVRQGNVKKTLDLRMLWTVLGVLLGLAVLIAGTLVALRLIHQARRSANRRSRRRNRRRSL